MKTRLAAISVAFAGASTLARAEEPRKFEELTSGIQLTARAGVGTLTTSDLTGFLPSGALLAGELSPGPVLGGELLYRSSRDFAFGVGASFSDLGLALPSGAGKASGRDLRGLVRWLTGTPGEFSEWSFDLSLGLGRMAFKNAAGEGLAAAEAFTVGARVGWELRPLASLPNLRVGPWAGVDGWIAREACTGAGASESCQDVELGDTANVMVSAGVEVRFDLPLTYKPRAEFVTVVSEVQVATTEGTAPEVTETPQYREVLPQVRQVALQAPNECASRTAANATGLGTATGTLVKTTCGVEMGELERALTRAGYVVQSWNTLAAMVRDQHVTPREAAAQLGAQVLFQVNSLEQVKAVPVTGARWERRYFHSDALGTQGAPALLPESERLFLREMVARQESELLGALGSRQGAMLDVNAISVSTGQTLWFYRWQRLDTPSASRRVSALASREGAGYWFQVMPITPASAVTPVDPRAAVESGEQLQGGGAQDVADATYFRLMREVVTDFVQRFNPNAPR